MKFYKFNIGDFLSATLHLTMEETGVYVRLLMHCYKTEGGIEEDDVRKYIICGARTKNEKKTVDEVLQRYFFLDNQTNTWQNERFLEELDAYHQVSAKLRENGKKGGRPTKKSAIEAMGQADMFQTGAIAPTQNNVVPISSNPTAVSLDGRQQTATSLYDGTDITPLNMSEDDKTAKATTAALIRKHLISVGISGVTSENPNLKSLLSEGAEISEFVHAAEMAVQRKKTSYAYVLATVRGARAEAAKNIGTGLVGALPTKTDAAAARSRAATAGWQPPEARAAMGADR